MKQQFVIWANFTKVGREHWVFHSAHWGYNQAKALQIKYINTDGIEHKCKCKTIKMHASFIGDVDLSKYDW